MQEQQPPPHGDVGLQPAAAAAAGGGAGPSAQQEAGGGQRRRSEASGSSDAEHGRLTVMQRYHLKRKQHVQKMEQDVAEKVRGGHAYCTRAAAPACPCSGTACMQQTGDSHAWAAPPPGHRSKRSNRLCNHARPHAA